MCFMISEWFQGFWGISENILVQFRKCFHGLHWSSLPVGASTNPQLVSLFLFAIRFELSQRSDCGTVSALVWIRADQCALTTLRGNCWEDGVSIKSFCNCVPTTCSKNKPKA